MSKNNIHSLFGAYLVDNGLATPEDIVRALNRQRELQAPLGSIALKHRYLNMKQVFMILNKHAETGRRFGDIALDFGFLTQEQLQELLTLQTRERPLLGQLLVEMGVLDMQAMQSHHEAYSRQTTALLDPSEADSAALN